MAAAVFSLNNLFLPVPVIVGCPRLLPCFPFSVVIDSESGNQTADLSPFFKTVPSLKFLQWEWLIRVEQSTYIDLTPSWYVPPSSTFPSQSSVNWNHPHHSIPSFTPSIFHAPNPNHHASEAQASARRPPGRLTMQRFPINFNCTFCRGMPQQFAALYESPCLPLLPKTRTYCDNSQPLLRTDRVDSVDLNRISSRSMSRNRDFRPLTTTMQLSALETAHV